MASKWQHELNWTSQQDRDVRDVLMAWEQARRERAHTEMAAAAAERGEQRHLQAKDGFGGHVELMVHPESFHYWGQKLGYQCWNDDGFKREYWRDNPQCRVKATARQTTVAVPDTSALAKASKRFTKSYG
jgi:hypothetical protein